MHFVPLTHIHTFTVIADILKMKTMTMTALTVTVEVKFSQQLLVACKKVLLTHTGTLWACVVSFISDSENESKFSLMSRHNQFTIDYLFTTKTTLNALYLS